MSELLTSHEINIRRMCRLCGVKIPVNGKRYPKSRYEKEIRDFCNIDIACDISHVHPDNICNACRLRLKRSSDDEESMCIPPLYEYLPHSADCNICISSTQRGNPKLMKKGKPVCTSTNVAASATRSDSEKKLERFDISTESVTGSFEPTVIDSIEAKNFCTPISSVFVCVICQGVSSEKPLITQCEHIFCKPCIENWLKVSPVCPVCRFCLGDEDISPLHGKLLTIFESLLVKCQHCDKDVPVLNYKLHEIVCKKHTVRLYDVSNRKQPIPNLSSKHLRHVRLKKIIGDVNDYCTVNNESKTDVLYFMLRDHLKQIGDSRFKDIDSSWKEASNEMSADQCLAMRIDLLQSKGHYNRQYLFLKQNNIDVFQPPSAVEVAEKHFLPNAVTFQLLSDEGQVVLSQDYSDNTEQAFINITDQFLDCLPEVPSPNCTGMRFTYPAALAKAISDLESEVNQGLSANNLESKNVSFITTVKDGGDGMGDVSVYKEKGLTMLPDKAFRFSFAIVEVKAVTPEGTYTVFQNEKPNSVRTNRPLLEAIADENFKGSNYVCMAPIERERTMLSKNSMKVTLESGGVQCHKFRFFNSMIDEKRDRADAGLQGPGSKYLCTLCHADRETCKTQLGSFEISRCREETSRIAEYVRVNGENFSSAKLAKLAKGVKSQPLSEMEQIQKGVDATHADINLGKFFKKIIVREMAGTSCWEMTSDIKATINAFERKFDAHMKKETGINPQLMMPGNYARSLFSTPHTILLRLIENEDRRERLSVVLEKFNELREVYRCLCPMKDIPEKVHLYKQNSVAFGQLLIQNFQYADWPNYLHKVIEHVQQLILDPNGPGSVGAFSSEGNECGNKLFRHFRKNLSRRGSVVGSLRDVLHVHWLYSCPKLVNIAEIQRRKNKCSKCLSEDHIIRNCPLREV